MDSAWRFKAFWDSSPTDRRGEGQYACAGQPIWRPDRKVEMKGLYGKAVPCSATSAIGGRAEPSSFWMKQKRADADL